MMITTLEVIEVKVRLHCKACERSLRRALSKIKGVRCVEIDALSNKITVIGYVELKVVVKAIWKTGRRVEVCSTSLVRYEEDSPRVSGVPFRCIFPKCFSRNK